MKIEHIAGCEKQDGPRVTGDGFYESALLDPKET